MNGGRSFYLCEAYSQGTVSTSSKSTVEKPLSPRNETNLCGLQNQGATWWDEVLFFKKL